MEKLPMNKLNPNLMTSLERIQEITSILALAILRLHKRKKQASLPK